MNALSFDKQHYGGELLLVLITAYSKVLLLLVHF